ncbi:MAG TPA: cell envelope integrity protein TolA [Gammaproteobacteria bacterium]|nr:cell envelope integrity protein TolA [Gammaproteobacteria bacterium]
MLKLLRNNLRALSLAILVHVALIVMLVISLDWKLAPQPAGEQKVIQATVVDEAKVQAEMEKLTQQDVQKKQQEQERQKRLEELKQQQQDETARLQQLKQEQQAAEQQREEQARLHAEQQKTEAARLETLKQQQSIAEQRRKEEEQRAEELKKKLAEEDKQRKEMEQQRLAEGETKRKIEEQKRQKAEQEAQRRREAEEQLKQQLAAEQAAGAEQNQQLIAQYVGRIQREVTQNWLRPPTARLGMSCTVMVNLAPNGDVLNARVVASSGDTAFDRSVEAAVYKASPLPLPPDPALFEYFRELNFIFKP